MIKSLVTSLTSPHIVLIRGILRFIALHRYCVFYKLKARLSTNKKIDLLYYNSHFITVVWNHTGISPSYACILLLLHWSLSCSSDIPDMHLTGFALAVSSAWIALLLNSWMIYYLTFSLSSNVTSVSLPWPPYLSKANLFYSVSSQGDSIPDMYFCHLVMIMCIVSSIRMLVSWRHW